MSRSPELKGWPEVRVVADEQSALHAWLWSPVTVLRTALLLVYLISIYAGIIATWAGIPLFGLLELNPTYTLVWAIVLGASAAVAGIAAAIDGSDERRWLRSVEKWAGIVWVSTFGLYALGLNYVAYHEGDPTRVFVSAIALGFWVLPASRSTWLAAQAGKRRE